MKVYISAYTQHHTTHVQMVVNARTHEHAIRKVHMVFEQVLTHLEPWHIEAHTTPDVHMTDGIHAHIMRVRGSVCNGKVLIRHGNAHTGYTTPYTTHIHNSTPRTHHTIQEHCTR